MTRPYFPSNCVICGSGKYRAVLAKDEYDIVECDGCGLVFVSPLPSPDKIHEFYNIHAERSDILIAKYLKNRRSRERRNRRKLKLLAKICGKKGNMLDIGCGIGLFVKDAAAMGWQAQGIDIDKDSIDYGTKAFSVRLNCGDLEEASFPDGHFDAITMFNLIDHLREPVTFLKKVAKILRPGGVIYLNVHDAGGWKAKKERERWGAFYPPAHLYYYSHETLEKMLGKAGLKFYMVPGINFKEGIKMLAIKQDDPREEGRFGRFLSGIVYGLVQKLRL